MVEPGPVVGGSASEEFLELLQKQITPTDVVLVSGSQPRGLKANYTAGVINAGKRTGCFAAVDISGQILTEALESRLTLVKVNEVEFKTSLSPALDAPWSILVSAARELISKGTNPNATLEIAGRIDMTHVAQLRAQVSVKTCNNT